ncbi:MAG: endonuclease/exonuclease/phosphatase family protein [Anaerolineae bacterium]|nr:endonuclease/exonuclease/phosphatase family protein [Anaerolineae bacterium]
MLRVMTYNILKGGRQREQAILEVLRYVQPDLAVLQEVRDSRPVEDWARSLGMRVWTTAERSPFRLALMSRLPVTFWQTHRPFPPAINPFLEAEVECSSGERLRVYGVHLAPWYSILTEAWRQWEIRTVLQKARAYLQDLCLLLGDFNTIGPSDTTDVRAMPLPLRLMILVQGQRIYRFAIPEVLRAGFVDCFRTLHPADAGRTLPASAPNARLDYIFASPPLLPYLRACKVVGEPHVVREASDHLPLVAEFDL